MWCWDLQIELTYKGVENHCRDYPPEYNQLFVIVETTKSWEWFNNNEKRPGVQARILVWCQALPVKKNLFDSAEFSLYGNIYNEPQNPNVSG